MTRLRIYLASSWRNEEQPAVVAALRAAGHEVYDFRHPEPGNDGFSWTAIDPAWKEWTPAQYRDALEHRAAEEGYDLDMDALEDSDVCVLLQPCGRSVHLELGYAVGAGKPTAALLRPGNEPELMYRMVTELCLDLPELLGWLDGFACGLGPMARREATP